MARLFTKEQARAFIKENNIKDGTVRKITKTKSSFPTNDALVKLLYLVIIDTQERTSKARSDWTEIINQLVVYYGERVSKHIA